MKTLILVFTVTMLSIGAYAQTDSSINKMNPADINNTNDHMNQNQNINLQGDVVDDNRPDGVTKKGGKMMVVKDGKMTKLEHDMIMGNGTKIMSDGTCIKIDGTQTKFKNGDYMNMSGNMIPMNFSNPQNK